MKVVLTVLFILGVIGIVSFETFVLYFNPSFNSLLSPTVQYHHQCYNTANRTVHSVQKSHTEDHIFHFVQLSDIHISNLERYASIVNDLEHAAWDLIPNVIQPRLVIVTGDLTHASYPHSEHIFRRGSNWIEKLINLHRPQQNLDEWTTYHRIASRANQILLDQSSSSHRDMGRLFLNTVNGSQIPLPSTMWFDCPGNHDRFNVPVLADTSTNMFKTHSCCLPSDMRNLSGEKTLSLTLDTKFGSYDFIQIDGTPDHGGFAPINFFGIFKKSAMDELEMKLSQAEKLQRNATVMYGHYPQSLINFEKTSSGMTFRQLSHRFPYAAYLSGHLHTVYNLVPQLKAKAPTQTGHYEWEMPDFKENRFIRILAIDHDQISHVDSVYNLWPKILVTSPVSANCKCAPVLDEIRMLIFTPGTISRMHISIDDASDSDMDAQILRQVELYKRDKNSKLIRIKYDPHKYQQGLHTLRVRVTDSLGNEEILVHTFSLDDTNCYYSSIKQLFFERFILFTEFRWFFPFVFYMLITIGIAILLIMKFILDPNRESHRQFSPIRGLRRLCHSWYYNFFLIVFCMMPISPWLLGEISTGEYALFFDWGLFYLGRGRVEMKSVVTSDMYFNLTIPTIVWLLCPLFALLVFLKSFPRNLVTHSRYQRIIQYTAMSFTLLFCIKSLMIRFWRVFVRTYGQYALFFSPLGTWLQLAAILIILREAYVLYTSPSPTAENKED